ncbi:hypothetical protein [Kitasatospora sp. NPDC093558]|uniref:hypothetical protein n=1 Tax=Kitasatospora sp. NPDC093558 TaxID=3155201 RepID=UPI00341EDEFB
MRGKATSQQAEERRAAAEAGIRAKIARLGGVAGLEPVFTRFGDDCFAQRRDWLDDRSPARPVLSCNMAATAYFGVRGGDVAAVLPGIRNAGLTAWGPQDADGQEDAYAAGTIRYAIKYLHDQGRFTDGRLMASPALKAPGLGIDWDRQGLPLVNVVEEPKPCDAQYATEIYHRCESDPKGSVAEARARYGTVLTLSVDATGYFTVARKG